MEDLKTTLLFILALAGLVLSAQFFITPLDTEIALLPTATPSPLPPPTATPETACPPTPVNSAFGYLPDAPFTTTLVPATTPGEWLTIAGTVYAADCETPIPNLLLEVWHNDTTGLPTITTTLRAQFRTDAQGRYSFSTIRPGGSRSRPAHIHYRITYPDGSNSLGTRIFFEQPPVIVDEFNDGLLVHPALVVTLSTIEGTENEMQYGMFDIILPVTPISATMSITP